MTSEFEDAILLLNPLAWFHFDQRTGEVTSKGLVSSDQPDEPVVVENK